MNALKILLEYILNKKKPDDIFAYLFDNGLNLIYKDIIDEISEKNNKLKNKILYMNNKRLEIQRRDELINIDKLLRNNDILPIHFKGSTLGILLYDDPYTRFVGDIDIYINENDYDKALHILYDSRYRLIEKFTDYTEHHFSLVKNNIVIELHKHFYKPYMNIDNIYFKNDTIDINILNYNITTLNHTSLLIYLFLHHYMHIVDFNRYNNISLIANSKIEDVEPQFNRFYEIALLIEKYNNSIKWNDFAEYLCSQPLNYEFKIIIKEFNNLFIEYIPSTIFNKLYNKEYIILDNMKLYLEIENDYRLKDGALKFTEVLMTIINEQYENNMIHKCNQRDTLPYKYYIDEHSKDKYNINNTYIQYGISPDSSEDLSYYFDFSIDDNFLYVNFDVTDDTLVFMEDPEIIFKDYNAILACDNCSIVIATGTGEYRYSNIFIYPVYRNNEMVIVAYDLKQKITNITEYVNPEVNITEKGYHISTSISLDYLKIENYNGNHFYMDVAVCDCDDITVGRKSVVSFSSRNGYWYDPRKFAKIIIEK